MFKTNVAKLIFFIRERSLILLPFSALPYRIRQWLSCSNSKTSHKYFCAPIEPVFASRIIKWFLCQAPGAEESSDLLLSILPKPSGQTLQYRGGVSIFYNETNLLSKQVKSVEPACFTHPHACTRVHLSSYVTYNKRAASAVDASTGQ